MSAFLKRLFSKTIFPIPGVMGRSIWLARYQFFELPLVSSFVRSKSSPSRCATDVRLNPMPRPGLRPTASSHSSPMTGIGPDPG